MEKKVENDVNEFFLYFMQIAIEKFSSLTSFSIS